MLNVPLPFQCCPHSCSKSPFLLLGWHLFPIHCLHGSSALASETSWHFLLISLTLCSLWELLLEHRIALSSISGALQNSLRSGKVQTSVGAFSVPGALTKSSWTLQHQGRPGSVASSPPLRQQGCHCPSVAVNLTGARSVSHHPLSNWWNCLTVPEAFRRDGQTHRVWRRKVQICPFNLNWWKCLCLGYREGSQGFQLFSGAQQSSDGLLRWLFTVCSSK